MTTLTGRVEVRAMTEDELPALLALWEEAGWGTLSDADWVARHRLGPHGPSLVTVAVGEDGTLLGQVTMLRRALNVRGETLPVARISGLIMSPRFRKAYGYAPLIDHPIRRMLTRAITRAADDGVVAVYAVPDKRVLRMAALVAPTGRVARFPFWSRPLLPLPDPPAGYEIVPTMTREDVDEVWARCRGDLVGPVRSGEALEWKSLFSPLRVQGIRRGGALVAVVASRAHGDRQWLIEDLLAVDDNAGSAAVASVGQLAAQESEQRELRKVGALVAPGLEPALRENGFAPDDWTFNLLVLPLGRSVPAEAQDPARWRLTPND